MKGESIDLRAFFRREDVCHLMHEKHGVGWFDGGCLTAATAIGLFLGTGHLACIYARTSDVAPLAPMHFCWIYGMIALDADGACSRLTYPGKYAMREGLVRPVIESVSKSKRSRLVNEYGFILDWGIARKLAAMMRKELAICA